MNGHRTGISPVPLVSAVAGQGEPLVILHGLFGAGRNWGAVTKSLADSFGIHALDMRNHGDSPWSPDMSYSAMVADLVAYMDAHGLARATVLGHSMGGKAAM
ncbi:MAG: alpha/beta fold hydrolase, partial [Pseudomonadota bacterium]|nr:alpha/beta fold hydrolase [Pseudomonadota bacterium]